MELPTELQMWHADTEFRARFDYDPGETERFDAQAGVGNPGREPSVKIQEVNFGAGWESPAAHPHLDLALLEGEVMQKLADLEEDERAQYDDAAYSARLERDAY